MKNFAAQIVLHSRYPFAVGAGLLLAAAFPNIGMAGFAWIAPALLLASAYGKTGAEAFRIGYVGGLTFYLASLYWLLLIPVTGYPILGWLALSGYVALYPATWVWLLSGKVGAGGWVRRTTWALAGAALWVALEMTVSRLFTGFPWNLLGNSQYRLLPLIQIASITGVYGVAFLVVWTSLALYSATLGIFRRPTLRLAWQRDILLPLIALVAVFLFGFNRLREPIPESPTLRVTFVQPNIPQTMIWDPAQNTNRFQQVLALSERALAQPTDLLLWPEAALPELDKASFIAITNLIATHGVWMIFGADEVVGRPTRDDPNGYDVYNAAFFFDPAGRYLGNYRKRQLVVFGEYIPLVRWLPFIKWFTPITGGFASGDRPVTFELERRSPDPARTDASGNTPGQETGAPARVKTSVLICFEDVFPHLVPDYVTDDTDFLVNLTNDGWFGEGAEQWQHAASGVFRAVENGVPLVRSCNNGLTCWIDARGQMMEIFRDPTGSVYGTGTLTARIPLLAPGEKRIRTFYNEHGDWFGWLCVIGAAPVLLARLRTIIRHMSMNEAFSKVIFGLSCFVTLLSVLAGYVFVRAVIDQDLFGGIALLRIAPSIAAGALFFCLIPGSIMYFRRRRTRDLRSTVLSAISLVAMTGVWIVMYYLVVLTNSIKGTGF